MRRMDPEKLGSVFLSRGLSSLKDNAVSVRKWKGTDKPLQKQGEKALIEVIFTHLNCCVLSLEARQGSSQNRNSKGCHENSCVPLKRL